MSDNAYKMSPDEFANERKAREISDGGGKP